MFYIKKHCITHVPKENYLYLCLYIFITYPPHTFHIYNVFPFLWFSDFGFIKKDRINWFDDVIISKDKLKCISNIQQCLCIIRYLCSFSEKQLIFFPSIFFKIVPLSCLCLHFALVIYFADHEQGHCYSTPLPLKKFDPSLFYFYFLSHKHLRYLSHSEFWRVGCLGTPYSLPSILEPFVNVHISETWMIIGCLFVFYSLNIRMPTF